VYRRREEVSRQYLGRCCSGCRRLVVILRLDDWYDDDDQQEDDTQCYDGGPLFINAASVPRTGGTTRTDLGVLPPHLLANPVGTLAERLRRYGQII